ncbi:Smr/MutS family protein [Paenirhodobacter enshiensis]|uniref:DNA mismatch repair protein MutS n=1 Tax=Paenirhodobacter enshiensis TaxID=1105367 RepID=A0A086Y3K3_9RHOB|nr:Smr/MutS family protein [Paenirhodobacter enshiensis]KFI28853.1 DNA mismatch repair protein MutS [Paenirhodobacter enshiensis]
MKRRRGLSEEERELWQKVAASAQALHPVRVSRPAEADPVPVRPDPAARLPEPSFAQIFRVGEQARPRLPGHDLAPSIGAGLAAQPVAMDRKAHRAMLRGKMEPEARLDLHGMTLAEAHPELIRFVLSAQDRGCRLILVITGKGKHREDTGPIPTRVGVLRHQVPQWLRLPPLSAAILQITEAHLKHGGAGAYYIYLRRLR